MRRTWICISSTTACLVLSVCQTLAQAPEATETPSSKAWSVLQSGLDKKGEEKAGAVRALGLVEKNPKATELAVAALDDSDADVRVAAAQALGQMQARSSIPKLESLMLTEKEVPVIIASADSLLAMGDSEAYRVYYAILTGERKSGKSLGEEQKKMLNDPKKMAQFGFVGFVPFGGLGYGAFKALTKDDTSPVRASAAHILAKDPDSKSEAALVTAAFDKSWIVRASALNALALRGDPSVIPQIEPVLDDGKSTVRYAAAAAIIHLAEVQAEPARKPARKSKP